MSHFSGIRSPVPGVHFSSRNCAQERGMDLAFLSRLIDQGALHPAIDRIFSLEEAAAAHQYAESDEAKVVVPVLPEG